MSKENINFILTFTVICALSAFIGWCSGFDFDHRNEWVGFWVAITILFASAISAIIAEMTREDEK
jgi:hypothetical protein